MNTHSNKIQKKNKRKLNLHDEKKKLFINNNDDNYSLLLLSLLVVLVLMKVMKNQTNVVDELLVAWKNPMIDNWH